MNIVDTWLGCYERPTDALNDINTGLPGAYNTGNLTQWKKEQKGISPSAYNFMLAKVLVLFADIGYEQLRAPDPKSK